MNFPIALSNFLNAVTTPIGWVLCPNRASHVQRSPAPFTASNPAPTSPTQAKTPAQQAYMNDNTVDQQMRRAARQPAPFARTPAEQRDVPGGASRNAAFTARPGTPLATQLHAARSPQVNAPQSGPFVRRQVEASGANRPVVAQRPVEQSVLSFLEARNRAGAVNVASAEAIDRIDRRAAAHKAIAVTPAFTTQAQRKLDVLIAQAKATRLELEAEEAVRQYRFKYSA